MEMAKLKAMNKRRFAPAASTRDMQPGRPPADALARALERDSAWLHGLARALTRDAHTAADAAQGALLTAWERAPDGRPPSRAWLSRVLQNVVRWNTWETALLVNETVSTGSPVGTHALPVTRTSRGFVVQLSWRVNNAALTLQAVSPSGVVLQSTESDGRITLNSGPRPEPGTWDLRVSSPQLYLFFTKKPIRGTQVDGTTSALISA